MVVPVGFDHFRRIKKILYKHNLTYVYVDSSFCLISLASVAFQIPPAN
jgi:hypothetical protein